MKSVYQFTRVRDVHRNGLTVLLGRLLLVSLDDPELGLVLNITPECIDESPGHSISFDRSCMHSGVATRRDGPWDPA
jgi:hypothetical protein